jgi:hypothetical protein
VCELTLKPARTLNAADLNVDAINELDHMASIVVA